MDPSSGLAIVGEPTLGRRLPSPLPGRRFQGCPAVLPLPLALSGMVLDCLDRAQSVTERPGAVATATRPLPIPARKTSSPGGSRHALAGQSRGLEGYQEAPLTWRSSLPLPNPPHLI